MIENKRRGMYQDLPDWLSPAEVCAYLSLGRSTVYELIRSGEIYSRKFGRLVRVPKTALSPPTTTESPDSLINSSE